MPFTGKESAAYFADGEPKFPFCGKIIEAYYTSAKLDNICVVHNYEVPDDGHHTSADGVTPNGGEIAATVYNIRREPGASRSAKLLTQRPEIRYPLPKDIGDLICQKKRTSW